MKRFVLFVFFFSVMAIMSSQCVWAQITISKNNNINIGNAIAIDNSKVIFNTPIATNSSKLSVLLPEMISLDLPKCGLRIGNGIESSSIIGGFISQPNDITIINPDVMNYGFLTPTVTEFMDLGGERERFRYLYVKRVFAKDNQVVVSDARYKENVKDLNQASDIIMALHPISFDFKKNEDTGDTTGLKNKVGFLAQELKSVLPHLVGYMSEADLYTVDYISLIPYLVQAFQEEKIEKDNQVAALQKEVENLSRVVESLLVQVGNSQPAASPRKSMGKQPESTSVGKAKLFQNMPNPFAEKTIIRYELPKVAGNAYIRIYDVQGKEIRNFKLSHAQEFGQIDIRGGELSPGVYTYSLIVSGKVVDSKHMVVTE